MARTPLFAALRRSFKKALSASGVEAGPSLEVARERRRAFLRTTAGGALGLSVPAALAGCGDDTTPGEDTTLEVAIVGGGTAGLHCALRLKEAGIDSNVFEAQKRSGGRMFSARGLFPEDETQVCELGGELIDTGHSTLFAMAEEFGLVLDDRMANLPAGFQENTWFVGGVNVPEATITAQFVAVAPQLQADLAAADSDDAAYTMLDETPLDQYIDTVAPAATYPELNAVLQNAYRGEYGLENDQQSALNLVYLTGADDPDPFRIFGDSDERYHTHLGNDSFPTKLAEGLGADKIKLEHTLTAARDGASGGFELDFDTPDGPVTVKAKRLVFALPFTMLRGVDLTGLTLSDEKRNMIDTLGYGTNAKVMMGFSTRVWSADHNASGGMTTDLPVQQTWETTVGQEGTHGIVTNFLGGEQGVASGNGTPEAWAEGVLPNLETIWPGMEAAYTGTAVRMHWPTVPTMMGSYACYKPGQWAFFGTEGAREGDVHFCGEHTSLDYQGYMEGAAETGALVAAEIIDDTGGTMAQSHVQALGLKLLMPQACYKAWRLEGMNFLQRRRRVRAILEEAYRALESDVVK